MAVSIIQICLDEFRKKEVDEAEEENSLNINKAQGNRKKNCLGFVKKLRDNTTKFEAGV